MHVAVVSQNADLELDLRPRAEAEALAAAGYRVTLVGGTLNAARVRELTADEVELALYPMPAGGEGSVGQLVEFCRSLWLLTRTLVRVGRSARIDVVHTANPPDNVWLIVRVLSLTQRARPRFVFDQHDVAPVLLEEKFGDAGLMGILGRVARLLERQSFRSASLVVFANPEYLRRAEEESLLSSPAEIVPNGWSLPPARADGHRDDPERKLVAYIGAISEQDCVAHLVEAVSLLDDPRSVLVCVAGDGSARRSAELRAEELGIADSFRWLGWVYRREELGALVHAADVCVAPEVDSPFNRLASFVKLVEYMSAGAAIAAHPLAQNRALCADTIEYAPDMTPAGLAQALETLLRDEDHARRLGDSARARFDAEIAWASVGAPRLVEAYRRVFR